MSKRLRLVYLCHSSAGAMREWVDWINLYYPLRALLFGFQVKDRQALIVRADEMWIVGGTIDEDMRMEMEVARITGTPIIDLLELGDTPPQGRVLLPPLRYLNLDHELDHHTS